MFDADWDFFSDSPELRVVLDIYAAQAPRCREPNPDPEAQQWLPRVDEVAGVLPEKLSQIHGQLIALGLLNHRIADRGRGVEYRLSTLGRRALEDRAPTDQESDMDLALHAADGSDVSSES